MGHEQTEQAVVNMYRRLGVKSPDNYDFLQDKSNHKLNMEIASMMFDEDDYDY